MAIEKVVKADTLEMEKVETEHCSFTPVPQRRGNEEGRRAQEPEGKSRWKGERHRPQVLAGFRTLLPCGSAQRDAQQWFVS